MILSGFEIVDLSAEGFVELLSRAGFFLDNFTKEELRNSFVALLSRIEYLVDNLSKYDCSRDLFSTLYTLDNK